MNIDVFSTSCRLSYCSHFQYSFRSFLLTVFLGGGGVGGGGVAVVVDNIVRAFNIPCVT